MTRLLAIDPGREKSGLVVAEGATVLARLVVPSSRLTSTLREWADRYRIGQVVLGDRTGAGEVRHMVEKVLPGVPVANVSEADTTQLARRRYFADHPPRGWRRVLPLSLQVPPEAYDDYAAEIILKRYLSDKMSKT